MLAEFCTPIWVTVLPLFSEAELVPCIVVAEFTRPSWLVDELELVKPFWVTLEPFTRPTCTVVEVLAACAAEDRANNATEAKTICAWRIPFWQKLSD